MIQRKRTNATASRKLPGYSAGEEEEEGEEEDNDKVLTRKTAEMIAKNRLPLFILFSLFIFILPKLF